MYFERICKGTESNLRSRLNSVNVVNYHKINKKSRAPKEVSVLTPAEKKFFLSVCISRNVDFPLQKSGEMLIYCKPVGAAMDLTTLWVQCPLSYSSSGWHKQ
jgi:hypothetical protein